MPYDFYSIQNKRVIDYREQIKNRVKPSYHLWWDKFAPNLREFSEDIYSKYVVNETTGEFIKTNITWIFEFTTKDC